MTAHRALTDPLLSSVPNMYGELDIFLEEPYLFFFFCLSQFDSMGNTGGCQATYTVIPPLSTPANCSNVTFPGVLDVAPTDDNGPLSQYGWIDQVSDQNHSLEVVIIC